MGWGAKGATVGTYGDGGGANVNHHLSLPDSGWLRLLVDIFWGLILTNVQLAGAPHSCRHHVESMTHGFSQAALATIPKGSAWFLLEGSTWQSQINDR